MWNRFSLRSRLIIILVGIALLAAGIVIALGAKVGVESITAEVNERLVAARNAKAFEIENYFDNLSNVVETLAANEATGRAIREMYSAYASISEADTINCDAALDDFYAVFLNQLSERMEVRRDMNAFYPNSAEACYLQYHYIVANPNPVGEKDELRMASDGSRYSNLHNDYHPYFKNAAEEFGLYDLFLVDAATSTIIYSVFKEVDFGTNIFDFALILAVDLAYAGGPVLNEVGTFSQVAAALGTVVTLFYVAGLVERRDDTVGRLGLDSWAVVLTYAGGLTLLFFLR